MAGSGRFEKIHVAFQAPQQIVVLSELTIFSDSRYKYDASGLLHVFL